MNLHRSRTGRAIFAVLMATAFVTPTTRAADEAKSSSSLQMVPADAAFYHVMLRNREQCEAIAKSKAWAKLTALPLYKMAMQHVEQQLKHPDPQLAHILKLYEMPENQELVALLGELMSDEVFVYGGDSIAALLDLTNRANAANRVGQLNMYLKKMRGGDGEKPAVAQQMRPVLNVVRDNLKLVQVPEIVFGFRVKNVKAADAQLKRLEALLEPLTDQAPPLKGRLKKVKVQGRTFLSLALDGKMIPWDKISIQDIEEKEGEYDALVKKLKNMKFSVSLGVRGNYLLLAFGESVDSLDRLGGAGPKLSERPEMKPLAAQEGKPLNSVSYISKSVLARFMTSPEDVDGFADLAKGFLENAPLGDGQRKRLGKDIQEFAKDLKAVLPEPGAVMAYSYTTDKGEESYAYSWVKQPGKVEAGPLTLLHHVGGDPILAVVGRSTYEPERYRSFVKWIKVLHGHVEEFGMQMLPDEPKEMYQQFTKVFFPLLKRLDDVNTKMLLPSLADGQSAFVLDAKWKSKHWHMMAPATPEAMPLPEVAMVFGVSDAALLTKGMTEYRKLINDFLAAAKEMSQGKVPDIRVPAPESQDVKGGTLYFYPIPAILGLDKQVAPTAGLSEKVAVMAFSKEHAERLLADKPLKLESGPLANAKRPLLGAVYFDWPALIDAASPWVDFGVKAALAQHAARDGKGAGPKPEEILEQVQTVLEVLKVFKGATSITYKEGDATVTHTQSIIRDLK